MKVVGLAIWLAAACSAADISSISVCAQGTGTVPAGWDKGSCPTGEFDTHFMVLAPGATIAQPVAINERPPAGLGLQSASDEHSSVFAPGLLGGNTDYLFFVASGIFEASDRERIDVATMVLSGGSKPKDTKNGTWVWEFQYPSEGYGNHSNGRGAVFRAPMIQKKSVCPVDLLAPPFQLGVLDSTFDLKYAAPGPVIPDPTAPGHFLMIYEGTNVCLGAAGISIGVATSRPSGTNYAEVWPSYCGAPNAQCPGALFNFAVLPDADTARDTTNGPDQPVGAWGKEVCTGNTCNALQYPPSDYGRYAVLQDPGYPQCRDGEPSAFLDDVNPAAGTYVYVVYTLAYCNGAAPDLRVAQAQVTAGQRLSFKKWNGGFHSAGMGGADDSFLPAKSTALRSSCGAPDQVRTQGSISYIEDTQQYLLLFVCGSHDDPEGLPCSMNSSNCSAGHSWFWATNVPGTDLTAQKWNPPVEVQGSFQADTSLGAYKGLYPTLMSLGANPRHLKNIGSAGKTFAFYTFGCDGKCARPAVRQYSSRVLTIK